MGISAAESEVIYTYILLIPRPGALTDWNLFISLILCGLESVSIISHLHIPSLEGYLLVRVLEVVVRQDKPSFKH